MTAYKTCDGIGCTISGGNCRPLTNARVATYLLKECIELSIAENSENTS